MMKRYISTKMSLTGHTAKYDKYDFKYYFNLTNLVGNFG